MDGYNYWNFICKLKNYYYGNLSSSDNTKKEVNGRIKWFNDYFNIFQNSEYFKNSENPLPELKKGNIILVELGFNIGMEFGGRHYCIVLKNSSLTNKRVLVLPITTQKPSDYDIFKDTIYIQFSKIQGLTAKKDKDSPNSHKRWVNILNIRTISKDRIIYPIERGMPNMEKGQMREISMRIVSQIAMRQDLLSTQKQYKKLKADYEKLQKEFMLLKNLNSGVSDL